MIKIKVTLDGNADLKKFGRSLRTNILRSQTELARVLGSMTKAEVMTRAPTWRGTLSQRVIMKLFARAHRAEIMMASPLFNMIAMQNEFNTRGPRRLYKSSYPKLKEWADEKNIFLDKAYVIVGKEPGTRLGKQNKFFLPAFIQAQNLIPQVSAKVIGEALSRTRG